VDCFFDIAEVNPGASWLSVGKFGVGAQRAAPEHPVPALQTAAARPRQFARPELRAAARIAREPAATCEPQKGLLEGKWFTTEVHGSESCHSVLTDFHYHNLDDIYILWRYHFNTGTMLGTMIGSVRNVVYSQQKQKHYNCNRIRAMGRACPVLN
jgi:hypothetical protein